jgi:DNA-binding transcriptional ArsR family regulator
MARAAADESVFHAIACPTRRALLHALSEGEKNVSQLVDTLDVTQSAVSQQLAVLKRARLVEERAETRFRFYRLRPEPLAEVHLWMDRYRALIEQNLDALGRVLDAMPDEPDAAPNPKRRRRT